MAPESGDEPLPEMLARDLEKLVADATGEAPSAAARLLAENPIDVAKALSYVEPDHVGRIFDHLPPERQATVLAEADPDVQARLLLHVGDRGAALVSSLGLDDAADILEVLEEPEREDLLNRLDVEDAAELRELHRYDPETAGGIMTPEFVAVRPTDRVERILAILRHSKDAESIHSIFVVDHRVLVGVFSIRDLILAEPGSRASEFMTSEVISVRADEDQEVVVRRIETYHLPVLPVVDGGQRLLGIITVDDALTALQEEASEDALRIAGAPAGLPVRPSVPARVAARLPWLMVTLGGGCLAALAIQHLGGAVVSEVGRFLPIIGGMAGNVAMQSAAILVRGFATGEIDPSHLRRLLVEEAAIGSFIGLACGLGAGIMAWILSDLRSIEVGVSVSISLFVGTVLAATLGTLIPVLCRRAGIDPAITAGPFITTLNDIMGFSVYMAVASVLVPGESIS